MKNNGGLNITKDIIEGFVKNATEGYIDNLVEYF